MVQRLGTLALRLKGSATSTQTSSHGQIPEFRRTRQEFAKRRNTKSARVPLRQEHASLLLSLVGAVAICCVLMRLIYICKSHLGRNDISGGYRGHLRRPPYVRRLADIGPRGHEDADVRRCERLWRVERTHNQNDSSESLWFSDTESQSAPWRARRQSQPGSSESQCSTDSGSRSGSSIYVSCSEGDVKSLTEEAKGATQNTLLPEFPKLAPGEKMKLMEREAQELAKNVDNPHGIPSAGEGSLLHRQTLVDDAPRKEIVSPLSLWGLTDRDVKNGASVVEATSELGMSYSSQEMPQGDHIAIPVHSVRVSGSEKSENAELDCSEYQSPRDPPHVIVKRRLSLTVATVCLVAVLIAVLYIIVTMGHMSLLGTPPTTVPTTFTPSKR